MRIPARHRLLNAHCSHAACRCQPTGMGSNEEFADLNKMHNMRIMSCFIWGQNKDHSLGDSISDTSEKLL